MPIWYRLVTHVILRTVLLESGDADMTAVLDVTKISLSGGGGDRMVVVMIRSFPISTKTGIGRNGAVGA